MKKDLVFIFEKKNKKFWWFRTKIFMWTGSWLALRPTRKYCVLLRPGHWATLPTKGTPEVDDRSHSRLCFLMRKFSKNERRACDHRVWLLEWPQTKKASGLDLKIRKFEAWDRARLCTTASSWAPKNEVLHAFLIL